MLLLLLLLLLLFSKTKENGHLETAQTFFLVRRQAAVIADLPFFAGLRVGEVASVPRAAPPCCAYAVLVFVAQILALLRRFGDALGLLVRTVLVRTIFPFQKSCAEK